MKKSLRLWRLRKWWLSPRAGGFVRWKFRRFRLRVRCRLTGGHIEDGWGFSPGGAGLVDVMCGKCHSIIKRVPLDAYAGTRRVLDAVESSERSQ